MDDHDGHTATYWGPTTVKVVAQQHHVAHLVRRGEPPHLHPVQPLLRVEALITGIMARRTGFIPVREAGAPVADGHEPVRAGFPRPGRGRRDRHYEQQRAEHPGTRLSCTPARDGPGERDRMAVWALSSATPSLLAEASFKLHTVALESFWNRGRE